MRKTILAIEIVSVFTALIIRIWLVENNWLILIILAGLIASWKIRGDSLEKLGFSLGGLKSVPIFAFAPLAFAAIASLPLYGGNLPFKIGGSGLIFVQFGWAFLQQVILNSYFVNRLDSLMENRHSVILLAGIIFATVHAPNPFLMIATGVGGIFLSFLFLKRRNIYEVAIIHVLVSASLYYGISSDIHHYFVVGPKFFR